MSALVQDDRGKCSGKHKPSRGVGLRLFHSFWATGCAIFDEERSGELQMQLVPLLLWTLS
jgi:hypothetical protein